MVRLTPLYQAILTTQELAERLTRVQQTVQHVLASPLQVPHVGWPVPGQLAQIHSTMTLLAELLGHVEVQELVERLAMLLGYARGLAQDSTAPGVPTRGALEQLAEQLDLTQTTLQLLTAQLQQEQSAAGRFLEEPPRAGAGEA